MTAPDTRDAVQPAQPEHVPSITTWSRLEPRTRAEDLSPALEARTADPLWLLARQWQLGEFQGEDAGTPVLARLDVESARFTAVRYGPSGAPVAPLPADRPLESAVEAEDAFGAHDLRWAAETGQELLRFLAEHGAGAVRASVVARYPVPGAPAAGPSAVDETTAGYLRIMAGRVPHGTDVLRDHARGRFPGTVGVPPELSAAVAAAVADWLAWLRVGEGPVPDGFLPLVDTPGADAGAWRRERMEYAFAAAASDSGGETVLTAPEYDGDRLDWYQLDHDPGVSLGAPAATERRTHVVVPTVAAYPGMPATRFWQMEDADVNLGQVGAGTTDLARMILLEYATVYANDHFVVPVEVPGGSLTRVRSLVVTDSFGIRTLVPPAPYGDTVPGRGWGLFRPASAHDGPPVPLLVLPPAAFSAQRSAPVEEVRFLRDETANLAWAVERTVTGVTGEPIDRDGQTPRAGIPPRAEVPGLPDLTYTFATTVPENWVPLVPAPHDGRPGDVRLRRLPLRQPTRDGTPAPVIGHSRVLDWTIDPATGRVVRLEIPEEEVGRAGVRVVREWRLARWTDGSVRLWLARAKRTGGGTASSGLRYDAVGPR
ncbi:hypothetical protein [Actinomadura kijaniata]|uniref:hypothetical protein n=1 Tax=Actinomadura kijaniata TaxID=46161 RepID=UPI00082976C6|nr:hypothetical protein [Actinomadura kijaniata]